MKNLSLMLKSPIWKVIYSIRHRQWKPLLKLHALLTKQAVAYFINPYLILSASTVTVKPSKIWFLNHVDILFANEDELKALYETGDAWRQL